MELWIFYAILSALTAGFYSFVTKISAERNYNPAKVTFYSFISSTILTMFLFPFGYIDLQTFTIIAITLIAINGVTFYIGIKTRIQSLRNIDSAIYFPLYKTLGPFLVLLVSLFMFNEVLEFYDWIGIILGITVPLLLLTRKEEKRQKNLKLGLIYLVIGTISTVISAWAAKSYMNLELNIFSFLILGQIIAASFGYLDIKVKRKVKIKTIDSGKELVFYSFILGLFNIITLYFYLNSLKGNLAIAYTINSFSILVPIVLSIIIYKEHFNLRKALAVILSIAAIILFI